MLTDQLRSLATRKSFQRPGRLSKERRDQKVG
jgi:hypothetical protein